MAATLEAIDFNFLKDEIQKRSGIALTEDKVYLLESRLLPVIRKHQFKDLPHMARQLRTERNENVMHEITQAMTTNETSFYRDLKPFDYFRQTILPDILPHIQKRGSLRIWSAACSTGQEAYTLAMLLKEEQAKLGNIQVEIVGTDLAQHAVDKANDAVYTQFEVQRGLPIQMLMKYFTQEGDKWRIKPELKAWCKFRQFNLLDPYTALGAFDVVFCRNVLIYFEVPTKKQILEKIHQQMHPHGYLLLGAAESVMGITDKFTSANAALSGIFKKV